MSNFTVNVKNDSDKNSITISPINAWGFGCSVPPRGAMNFSFRSEGGANSITLAIIKSSEDPNTVPEIVGVRTDGGFYNVSKGEAKPCLVEITNDREKSVTDLVITDEHERDYAQ
jgi:hypothetical protein